jgi:hypothetical protein
VFDTTPTNAQYPRYVGPPELPSAPVQVAHLHDLIAGKWDGDSAPYIHVMKEIKSDFQSPQLEEARLASYRLAAMNAPNDPVAQYRWCYSAICFLRLASTWQEKSSIMSGVFEALLNAPFPKTYEYARAEFLAFRLEVENSHDFGWRGGSLASLGDRLLAVNSDDPSVEMTESSMLANKMTQANKVRAIELNNMAVKQDPTLASTYRWNIGVTYLLAYDKFHERSDGLAARAALQQYIDQESSTDVPNRDDVEGLIKSLDAKLAKQSP